MPRESVKSVDRVISILNTFTVEEPELGLNQLAMLTNLPKTTVFRMLDTLEYNCLVERNPETGKYRLGYGLMKLGTIARESNTLQQISRQEMQDLSKLTGQTSNLYIRDRFERVCIAQIEGTQYILRYSFIGARHPLYCGAGKLLLAYAGEDFLQQYLQQAKLERFTEHTITDPRALEEELERIRRQEYSLSRGERENSTAAIAVPLFDYTKKMVAGLTISGPIYEFSDDRIDEYVSLLKQASQHISNRMGAE